MAACCACRGPSNTGAGAGGAKASLPLICLVPRDDTRLPNQTGTGAGGRKPRPVSAGISAQSDFQLLDDDYIKKHFKLPQRALYLDPFRRPLVTFPVSQEEAKNFNMARKCKINQQILDGFLDPSEAISAPSVFPYAKTEADKRKETTEEDEEIIYILQLPDWEFRCPVHNETVRTPRKQDTKDISFIKKHPNTDCYIFIWHSCKKPKIDKSSELRRGGGPMNKPKPWLLSRHTDFDLMSQW